MGSNPKTYNEKEREIKMPHKAPATYETYKSDRIALTHKAPANFENPLRVDLLCHFKTHILQLL